MSSLSLSVLSLQNAFFASAHIADFRIDHVVDEDGGESIRVVYTIDGDAGDCDAWMQTVERDLGLTVVKSGPTGDGFRVTYAAA